MTQTDLPHGWAESTLSDVAQDISYGFTTSSSYESDNPKLLRITDVQDYSVEWTDVPFCSDAPPNEKLLASGDIVIARTGATTGKSYLLTDIPQPTAFASYLIRVRTSEAVAPEYLWKYMWSPEYWRQITVVSKGTAQPGANATILGGLQLPVPPVPEQRRIVAKLDRLSERSSSARDHLTRVTALATRAKQAILDKETVRGSEDCPTVLVEDVATAMFDGPFGSNLKSKDYTGSGVRVVRLENIDVMDFRADKETYISQSKFETLLRHKLLPNDLMFSSFVADNVRAALIPSKLGTAINKADCFCVRPNTSIVDPTYLLCRLSAQRTFKDMEKLVHGATRPRIGLKQLKKYEISLPTLAAQQEIVRRIKAAFARIDRLTEEASRASHLLDRLDECLLAKAFQGELVPQDPDDEPAEALLERIREARVAAPKPKRARRKKTA